jgi:hypothetical protein
MLWKHKRDRVRKANHVSQTHKTATTAWADIGLLQVIAAQAEEPEKAITTLCAVLCKQAKQEGIKRTAKRARHAMEARSRLRNGEPRLITGSQNNNDERTSTQNKGTLISSSNTSSTASMMNESATASSPLVPGTYRMNSHTVDSIGGFQYRGTGLLVLLENGTCEGLAVEQGNDGEECLPAYPCTVKDGIWNAAQITFTYVYGSSPFRYRLELVVPPHGEQPAGDASGGRTTTTLVGTWQSVLHPSDPNDYGVVRTMHLTKIA